MRYRTRRRFRFRIVPLGLALALIVVAVPLAASAAAKGPVFNPNPCAPVARNVPDHPRGVCDSRGAALVRQRTDGSGGADAGIVAGGAALLALTAVGGLLLASRRRGAPGTRPATQS